MYGPRVPSEEFSAEEAFEKKLTFCHIYRPDVVELGLQGHVF